LWKDEHEQTETESAISAFGYQKKKNGLKPNQRGITKNYQENKIIKKIKKFKPKTAETETAVSG